MTKTEDRNWVLHELIKARKTEPKKLVSIPPIVERLRNGGPGTELKHILSSIGINPKAKCNCRKLAIMMDVLGPDGCEKNLSEIVAALVKEAEKRNWLKWAPFKEVGAELLVKRAISAARKKISEEKV